jgi:hypothetical protein
MNEHIKRLARQAGFDVELMERNYANGNQSMAHQLAELIVKECEVALKPPIQVRDVISRGQAYDLIKKHFGLDDSSIAASESLHSDKGYSLGTPEAQEAFDSKRGYKL